MTPLEDRVNPVAVSITAGAPITEGGSDSAFTISRDNSSGSLTVNVSYSGTASQGFDYFAMITSILFSDGQSSQPLPISPWDDGSVEGTETIIASISSSMNYTISGTGSVTMNLYDNDTTQVTVAKQGGDPTEGGNGTFRITRSGSTSGDLTVNFTVGGTATSGTDFTSIGTSAKITSGNSYVDVTVPTLADNVVEASNETVTITITDNGTTYTANNANASMTIIDDAPVIDLTVDNTTEGSGTPGYVRFTRSGGNTADSLALSFTIGGTATNGTDYTTVSTSATIGAGNAYVDVNIVALADNIVEASNETVTLTITPSGTYLLDGAAISAMGTVTIIDDAPVVNVSASNVSEGGATGGFTFTRSGGDISSSISIDYTLTGTADPGDDYEELSGTVVIAADEDIAFVDVVAHGDNLPDDGETVIATIDSGGTDYTIGDDDEATVTINDQALTVSVARVQDGEEGAADGKFRFTRVGDLSGELTVYYSVSGTAVGAGDLDYAELSGSVTFDEDEDEVDVVIDVADDVTVENTETVTVAIEEDEGYFIGAGDATLFISDNDSSKVYWISAGSTDWDVAANWSINAVPDETHDVYFWASKSNVNCAVLV